MRAHEAAQHRSATLSLAAFVPTCGQICNAAARPRPEEPPRRGSGRTTESDSEGAAMEASSTTSPCSPHLKRVLKTYQLSAVKSLQGPSTVLAAAQQHGHRDAAAEEPPSPPAFPPPQPPILIAADQSRSERSETVLEGETITCFVVGGEKRLCLPQVLNSVLRDFTLQQINQVCDDLLIYCSRCNPEQLEELKVTGVLPATAPSCGLITKTDAERLCSALLHRGVPLVADPASSSELLSIKVYHECFGKCKGICTPELYARGVVHCIECVECHAMFSPQTFVCHAHRALENRTCHWGFDSSNWRAYLHVAEDQAEHERLAKLLDAFKRQASTNNAVTTLKRKQTPRSEVAADLKESSDMLLKRARLDADPYHHGLYHVYPEQVFWCESWSQPRVTAFRATWPPLPKEKVAVAAVRDSVVTVPAYLSHSPPVLLHPERVVPLSESERFERSFQPNVALAPIPRSRVDPVKADIKMEMIHEDLDGKTNIVNHETSVVTTLKPLSSRNPQIHYNPEIELSTDTDDSLSDAASLARMSSKTQANIQVADILDTLPKEVPDELKAKVAQMVNQLVEQLEQEQICSRLLQRENDLLKDLLNKQFSDVTDKLRHQHSEVEGPVLTEIQEEVDSIKEEITLLEKELVSVRNRIYRLNTQVQQTQPVRNGVGSPVSVITSPPPTVKAEPPSSD